MLQLDIAGTDRSSWIDWTSLTKDEGLTRDPDTLSFFVKLTADKSTFTLGSVVELYEDSTLIFAGILVERRESINVVS